MKENFVTEKMTMTPIMVKVKDAIAISGIGRTRMFGLIKECKVDARKSGKTTLVSVASLENYLATLPPARPGNCQIA